MLESCGETNTAGRQLFDRFDCNKKGQFQPFPIAIDICEPKGTKPCELGLDIKKLIGRIFRFQCGANRPKKVFMQIESRRGNVFKITKNPSWLKVGKNLGIEGALALMRTMVNSKTRNDRIKS